MKDNFGVFISSMILGMMFGAILTVTLTPWAGSELREKLGLGHEDPHKKIERVKRALEKLEAQLEAQKG